MGFDEYESAQETSEPIELITVALGAELFHWTSAEDDITVSGTIYTAIPIQRGRIIQAPEHRGEVVEFTVTGDNELAAKYIRVVPGSRALITVHRVQRPDFPSPGVITMYQGYLRSVQFSKDGYTATLATLPIAAATSRAIPRFTYQSLCNNVLFDNACGVDDTSAVWRLSSAQVLTVVDSTITVQGADGKSDGYYTGGYVSALGGLDARMILEHTGTSLLLMLPFPFDAVGESVNVFAGCDHHISTCDTKFYTTEDATSNVINYGGFAFVPTRNIFTTGLD